MDNTLQQDCLQYSHTTLIKEWGYKLVDGDVKEYASLYGCSKCNVTSTEPFPSEEAAVVDHTKCGDDCFGCKVKNLQLNAGDAKHSITESGTTQKKWDKELDFYKEARSQGIQPESTTRAAVEKAYEASEVLNKPYDGGTMPKANFINNKTVEVMKEVGAI